MIIKRTIKLGEVDVAYEAVLQGETLPDVSGTVIVHDPSMEGGRKRAFILPQGQKLPQGHVVITRIALKP